MPGLFCLAMHPALQTIHARLPPGAEVLAYLDDVYITCDPEDAAFILENVKGALRDICHIDIHMGKLRVWGPTPTECPDDLRAAAPGAWKADAPLAERGVKVLGTPFGSNECIRTFGANVATKRAQLLQYLPQLPLLQVSWLLLYFCAVPKLNHLLRTLPPDRDQELCMENDVAILDAFRNLFNIPTPAS